MNRIEREPCFYHDESGERFHQLFADAEIKRAKTISGIKQTAFWFVVIMLGGALLCLAGMTYGGK
jgi:hypothetical protein